MPAEQQKNIQTKQSRNFKTAHIAVPHSITNHQTTDRLIVIAIPKMPSKRPLETTTSTPSDPSTTQPPTKKPKHGFRLPAPDNLPDGPWRRKAAKIKTELIGKAKVRKEYAKLKKANEAQEQEKAETKEIGEIIRVELPEPVLDADTENQGDVAAGEEEVPEPQLHPDRIAMLDQDEEDYEDVNGFRAQGKKRDEARRAGNGDQPPRERERGANRRQARKPGYYDKELAEAEQKKQEAEARAAERERQQKEREKAIKERERHRRIMAKARSGGRDGKRKLGKESVVLLDRVKRLVGN